MDDSAAPAPQATRPPRLPSRLTAALHLAALALLPLAVYSNSFRVPFLFDDVPSVVENPAVRDLATFFATGLSLRPRVVGDFTFALDHSLFGTGATGFHVTNLVIHVAATWLVYALVRLVFATPALARSGVRDRAPVAALIAAALFAAHPLQTQAVTYVVQRHASLAATLYLLSVVAWLRARLAEAPGPRAGWLTGSIVAMALALVTKQNAATLPAVLLSLEVGLFEGPLRKRAVWLLPSVALTAVGAAVMLSTADLATTSREALLEAEITGPAEYLLTQLRVLVAYLRLLLLPAGQNLDHAVAVARTLADPGVLPSLALLVALAGAAAALVATRARRDGAWCAVGLGGLWFFVTHAVESSVVVLPDLMFEHRMYLPSVGPLLAAGTLVAISERWLAERRAAWRRAPLLLAALAVAALAVVAHARNEVWRDAVTLWSDAAAKAPGKARPHCNLGAALLDAGRPLDALRELETARRLAPDWVISARSLARVLTRLGDRERAREADRTADRLLAKALCRLGEDRRSRGRLREARATFQNGLAGVPADGCLRRGLALVQAAEGDARGAEQQLRIAASTDPSYVPARTSLGSLLLERGAPEEAIAVLEAGLALDRTSADAWEAAERAYRAAGRPSDADRARQEADRLRGVVARR